MSKFIDALTQGPPESRRYCGYTRFRESLSPDEVKALDVAVAKCVSTDPKDHSYTLRWLARVINGTGFTISDYTVRRHMRGECACDKSA